MTNHPLLTVILNQLSAINDRELTEADRVRLDCVKQMVEMLRTPVNSPLPEMPRKPVPFLPPPPMAPEWSPGFDPSRSPYRLDSNTYIMPLGA